MNSSLYSHIFRHIQVAILLVGAIAGGKNLWGGELRKFAFSEVHMGVPLNISVYVDNEAAANKGAAAAFARVAEIDQQLSDYKIDSELNQLSLDKPHNIAYPVSDDLFHVLRIGEEVSRESEGAFDVTVGPVVKLWRKASRQKELPDQAELQERRATVDYRAIHIDEKKQTVNLTLPGMRLDLGGIAKGYAADEALEVLNAHGMTRVLLDFGGDIVVGDPPPGKTAWTIAVAPLKTESGEEQYQYVDLKNGSIATSGDAYQFVEIAGVRYSHIVDPRTGVGLTDRSSVTIIAPNGTLADAWASAVSVLGPAKGLEKVNERSELEAFIITEKTTVASDGWHEYLHAADSSPTSERSSSAEQQLDKNPPEKNDHDR